MQIKIGKRILYESSWKRILYIVCFCFICVIDQRVMTCDPNGGGREMFRDLTGMVMAILILSHYKWQDIIKYKIFYIGWSILAVIGLPVLFVAGKSRQPFLGDWVVVVFDIFIWGYVMITTFISAFIEKKRPQLKRKTIAVWLLMMLLMIFSRSDLIWPVCYFIMFGCFYLTDYDEAEREDLFQGALSGIILAFFIFQGLCCLYRPYDAVRYVGWYTNTNNNALFYLSVLAAVLTKLYCAKRGQSSKWLQIYYYLGTGVVLSFIIMTIGRAAWITSVIMVIFLLTIMCSAKEKREWIRKGLILILCLCLTFPVCFAAVRYIPPLRHHPVWFFGEWSEGKVHSWDPWNSEKYIEIDEFFDVAGGRVTNSIRDLFKHLMPTLKVSAAEVKQPILEDGVPRDFYVVRTSIYKHFWSELNWRGHSNDEIGVQLTSHYWVEHAHNIFLQFGTNFGIPVMVLFAILIIWPLIICIKQYLATREAEFVGSFLRLLIPLIFGMFEFCWGAGSLTIFMIFFSWRSVFLEKSDGKR